MGILIIKRRMIIMRGASILTTITVMWVGIPVRIVIDVVSWARVFTGRTTMWRQRVKIIQIRMLTMRILMPLIV